MVKKLRTVRIERPDVCVYMWRFGEAAVESAVAECKFKIVRGGNYRDGFHRWSRFRLWLFCGSWNTSWDIRKRALEMGHLVEPWDGVAPNLPLWTGKTWVEYQRDRRKRLRK